MGRPLEERSSELAAWLAEAGEVCALSLAPWVTTGPGWKRVKTLPRNPRGVVLVLEPDWSFAKLEAVLQKFARAPAESRLILGFPNEASGGALVARLAGTSAPGRAWSEEEIARVAGSAGLRVVARQGFAAPVAGLALNTVDALRQLFLQLNPASVDDYVLLALSPTSVAPRKAPEDLVPGLLSVVMRNHALSRESMLDQAVFSLAAQSWRSLEIVLVTQAQEPDARARLEAILERHQPLGGYSFRVVAQPSSEDIRARLVNVGIAHARGQYLAFLDDDDVVYPSHYTKLIGALVESDRAWAFSPVRRAYFTVTKAGDLYCKKKDVFPRSGGLDLAGLLHDNYVTCHSYVIDRFRVGRFELGFEELLDKGEDYALVLRLLAVFRPVALGGNPTAEYRIRDNGTNTIIHDSDDQALRSRLQKQWEAAIEFKNRLTRSLQVLVTKEEFVAETRKGVGADEATEPEELRYRLADLANTAFKRGLPLVHSKVKETLSPKAGGKR